jgi:hypothetical protein
MENFMSYDEIHDCGFEMSDVRHRFICKDGEKVEVIIIRHWYYSFEFCDANFKASFDIVKGSLVTSLPVGVNQDKAVDIAHELYEEDEESTKEIREIDAMYEAERRFGA